MAGDLAEHRAVASPARSPRVERAGGDVPSEVCIVCANDALFHGRLDEAAELVPAGARTQRSTIRRST